jgi:hypothetical protein
MTNSDRLVSTREAAQILGVDTRSVQRRAVLEPTGRPGEIIARHKTPGLRGGYVFDEAYIRDLAQQRTAAAS